MMLLNTKFVVDEALTRSELLRLANEWLHKSRHYDISLDGYNGSDEEYIIESANSSKKIIVGNYESSLLLQIICSCAINNNDDDDDDDTPDESATYTTNYVLDDSSDVHMLHVSQEKVLTELTLNKKRPYVKLPILMKTIFWNELGGIDEGLITDDKPYFLRKTDMELAKNIINQTVDFCNPIVYVSPNSVTGHYDVNPNYLAHELMGQAHVVVESSPKIANDIREATNGENPFNGAVKVFLPGIKKSTTILPKDGYKYYNSNIINYVRDLLVNVGVDDKYNVAKLRQAHLFDKIKNGGTADAEFTKLCEEIINEKDSELTQLRKEIAELKQSLMTANAKADSLQGNFNKFAGDRDGDVLEFAITEADLYTDERKDVILKVLRKEHDAMKDDSNLSRSRKFDVLSDVLEHNFPSETDAELIECIKGAFKDGALSGAGIGRLQAAGFVVEKDGNQPHYHINLNGDDRYEAVFSATPSDKARGTKNLVSDFTNILFGF